MTIISKQPFMKIIKFTRFFDYTIAVVLLLVFSASIANAQNQSIKSLKVDDGTNSTTYNANAVVDLQSANKGLLMPRIALTATNSASPLSAFVAGMTVYNTATAGTAPNNVTPGYYYSDGTQWARLPNNAWLTTGNTGTTAGTNFLGTTDNQDLVFKRNNVQSGWLNNALNNTAFGVGSLPMVATGTQNTAFGANTLSANTTGPANTAIGYNALVKNTTGSSNVAVGLNALANETGGTVNTAIGAQALATQNGGYYNTAIGFNALNANQSTQYITAVGANALAKNTSGNNNTAVGGNALTANTTGSYNIAIGNNTLASNTSGGGNVGIGALNSLISGGGNIGIGGCGNMTTGTDNVSIGDASMAYIGSQTATSNVAIGDRTIFANATGPLDHNTAVGSKAGYNLSAGKYNIAIGAGTTDFPNNTGSYQMNIGNCIFGTGMTGGSVSGGISPAGNIGINTTIPGNSLEINQGTAGNSGLRFTQLPITGTAVAASTTSGKYLSVNATGDVVLANLIDPVYEVTGLASGLTSPVAPSVFTAGTITTPGGSFGSTTAIYVNETDGTEWVYNGTNYISYTPPNTTEWYLSSGTTDAGSDKTASIYRTGNVGIGTTTPTTALHVQNATSPAFRLVDGTQAAGRILTSDANGNASWQTLAVTSVAGTLPSSPTSFTSYGSGTPAVISEYTGGYITLPPGKWLIGVGSTVSINSNTQTVINSDGSLWCTANFSDSSTSGTVTADLISSYTGQRGTAGVVARGANKAFVAGYCAVNNTSGTNKTYYLWANQEQDGTTTVTGGGNAYWQTPFGSGYWERYFFAIPIQ